MGSWTLLSIHRAERDWQKDISRRHHDVYPSISDHPAMATCTSDSIFYHIFGSIGNAILSTCTDRRPVEPREYLQYFLIDLDGP